MKFGHPYNTGFKLDSVEFPATPTPPTGATSATASAPRRLLPGASAGCRTCAQKCSPPWPHGLRRREASPRGGVRPARARPEVLAADHGRSDAIYKYCIAGRQHLRQDRDLHAEADLRRQRLGHALPQSIWKSGKPVFAGEICRPFRRPACPISLASSSTPRRSTPSQSDDQLLQAPGPGLRGAGAPGLLGAQPLGGMPHPLHRNPKAKRVEVRFPDPLCNPYLGFAAMTIMTSPASSQAHPGDAIDKDLYDLPPKGLKKIPTGCGSSAKRSGTRQGSRVPQGWRRVRRRLHRQLHRAEDAGGDPLRAPASGRVRDVLLVLNRRWTTKLKGRSSGAFFISVNSITAQAAGSVGGERSTAPRALASSGRMPRSLQDARSVTINRWRKTP